MSKLIDEIHACEGDDKKIQDLLEKSSIRILLDIALFVILIYFDLGVLKDSAAMIPEDATITAEAVIVMYAIIYGGFALVLYLLIRHCLPFFVLGLPKCIILLSKAIKNAVKRLFAKRHVAS